MPSTHIASQAPAERPIITLTSDFGLRDSYVAVMKAAVLRHCPSARLIDVTHQVPAQDVLCGSITLERAIDGFPPGTVHLAVVDPGVGTDRRMLVVQLNGQIVVCPDNGLITWPWRVHPGGRALELTWKPAKAASHTFHGRDIFGPVAGMLAQGKAVDQLALPIANPILLDVAPAGPHQRQGRVIHVDHFGNATTNIGYDLLGEDSSHHICLRGRDLGRVQRTYFDVEPGKPLALVGSSGLLEIAVRDGSAEKSLGVRVGDQVVLE